MDKIEVKFWIEIHGWVLIVVAIKTLKKRESNMEFLKEAKTASALKHDNIVDLIGVCIESNFIILELMEGGDLLTYLKDMRR